MSSSTTPSRVRPVLMIPGIDGRTRFDGKTSTISCGGLPTPPQSALESRRPSLQFSTPAEYGLQAGSTMGAFSQPATPVRGMSRQGEHFNQGWPDHAAPTANTLSHHAGTFTGTHFSMTLLQPAFQSQPAYRAAEVDHLDLYTETTPTRGANIYGPSIDASEQDPWSPHRLQHTITPQVSELGPTLFNMSHVLGSESNAYDALGVSHASALSTQHFTAPAANFHIYGPGSSSLDSQPQVVDPSRLSPQDDFSEHQYHAATCPPNDSELYTDNFGSSTVSSGDWAMVGKPSPTSAYFVESDEDDWTHMRCDGAESPSPGVSHRRSLGTRMSRRGLRRTRCTRNSLTYRHNIGNTEVVCDGFDPKYGRPVRAKAEKKHQHRCTHLQDNGHECGRSFDKAEHLKRHSGMHSGERHYPCPLPDCTSKGRRIQRPDNAGDHFKTHLRPKKKVKRNACYDWPFVRQAIWSAYDDKKRAAKLLENLQKWIDRGMPESASQRRGAQ